MHISPFSTPSMIMASGCAIRISRAVRDHVITFHGNAVYAMLIMEFRHSKWVGLPFKVKDEFIVLSVVNDNTSRERGPKLFVCRFFADFLQRFLRQAFIVFLLFPLSSLSNVPVSSTMSLCSAGGRRKKEKKGKKKSGNCSKPGHTIECTYTANLSGWLDSSNDLSSATSKQDINSDIPFILRMNEHNHGSNSGSRASTWRL